MFRKKNKFEELDTSAVVTPIEEKAVDPPTKGIINFHINGESYSIQDPDPSLLLVDYLRSTEVGLTGTKHPCGQGGCGGCTVMLSYFDQHKESVVNVSINSCLRPVASLDGMEITTVEGLGSVDSEVSPVQYAIAKNNGSQCGYCTPGFVMNMHSLLIEKDGQELTKKQIEQAFDGNICRCTGFRPILHAMKTFATDWKPEDELGTMTCKVDPAEDVVHYKHLKGINEEHLTKTPNEIKFEKDGQIWIRPISMEALKAAIIEHKETKAVKLVHGNTSHGIPNIIPASPKVHIDIAHIKELKAIEVNSDGLVIGASTTYTELLDLLEREIPKQNEVIQRGLNALHYMAIRTAGKIVRNAASLAGNTMLVARNINSGYPFPSDLFTALSALETKIEVWHQGGTVKIETLEFLDRYSHDKYFSESVLIVAYHIPFTKEHDHVMNYKVAIRKENSHSLANAGFKLTLDEEGFIHHANLIVGGLTTHHKALTQTAEFLVGKAVNNETLEEALKVLTLEVIEIFESVPQWFKDLPTEGVHNDYRLSLVQSYLYKFFIHLLKETNQSIEKDLVSAPYVEFDRPVSKGKQTYSTDKDEYPLNSPYIKLSAFEQATGEAIYTHDIPVPVKGLQGAFVTSQSSFANFHYVIPKENGRPSPCDKAEVLAHVQSKFPGVVDYFNYEDIPEGGKNGVVKSGVPDPFFAEDEVTAFGQCIGLLVAETELGAINAAEYMTENCLAYSESKPILTMEEALEKGSFFTGYNPKTDDNQNITAPNSDLSWAIKTGVEGVEKRVLEYGETVLDNVPCLVVAGTQKTGAQIHFYMESQSCFTEPGEMKQMRVHPSSQSPNSVQGSVSSTLNVSTNNIQVDIKRLGGAYGGKTTRSPYIASPAAIASKKLKRPVRIAMPRKSDSLMIGHRHPFLGEFNVAIVPEGKHRGKMKGTIYEFYSNGGNTVDCSFDVMDCALLGADNSYNVDNFQAQGHVCKLNVTSNGAMRSYGSVQAGLITEEALEAAAHAIGMLPEDVREKNLYSMGDQTPFGQKLDYCIIKEVWHRLRETSEFDKRLKEVEKFNKNNKWKKRGISMIPMKYGLGYNLGFLMQGGALVDIYNHDGTVLVTHGGVEMGQGVMTKLAQIAAESLNIPLSMIQMTGMHTNVVPNATGSGATSSTDLNGGAVKKACEIQRKKLEDACLQLLNKNGSEWCRENGINYWDHPKEGWKAVVTTKGGTGMIWNNVISHAYQNVVDLSSQALYQTPGLIESEDQQFYGYTYSACCSEVEIDVLTGESNVVRTDMCYDIGKSLNPAIDVGQVEGAFIMGVGYMLTENVVWEPEGTPNPAGQMNTPNTWTYKPPSAATIPIEFNVDLFPREEASKVPENPNLLMSSKGIGEPPLVLANSVFFAIKHAVLAARKDRGKDEWFMMDAPATVQEIRNKCLVNENDLTL